MAALAAFLLLAATVASIGSSLTDIPDSVPTIASTAPGLDEATLVEPVRSARANRSFKVSLHLFRRN
jgi:hypothetical protein